MPPTAAQNPLTNLERICPAFEVATTPKTTAIAGTPRFERTSAAVPRSAPIAMQLQMPSRPPIARARAPSKGTSATCSIITDWPLGMRTLMATTVRAALSKAGIMELSRRESWKTRNADAATTSVPANCTNVKLWGTNN